MKNREKIDKWSLLYRFLQVTIVGPLYRLYYSKIQSEDQQKIPGNSAVIFAPNHQNALMDALAFVAGTNFQTVFLARADVFKSNKLVINILTFLKILPIYRIRDGRSELQKNDEIFELTQKVLRNRINPLCLYPEGNHGDRRRLRPLVKGIFRIAFMAQSEYGPETYVKIVPVGIDYGHYQKMRHSLFIKYGDPIDVSEFWKEYEENPSVAMNLLRERLAAEMKKVMIHIETEEYYGLYMTLRSLCRKSVSQELHLKPGNLAHQFVADKEIIRRLDNCLEQQPDRIATLNGIHEEYQRIKNQLKLRDWVPSKKRYSITLNLFLMLGSLFVLPLVLLGLLNNWPNYVLPGLMVKNIKDKQFHATALWGAGSAITMIYYPILAVLAIIFLPFWWLKLMYIFILPSSGVFAYNYRNFLIKCWAKIRYSWRFGKRGKENITLKNQYNELTQLAQKILDDFSEPGRNSADMQ